MLHGCYGRTCCWTLCQQNVRPTANGSLTVTPRNRHGKEKDWLTAVTRKGQKKDAAVNLSFSFRTPSIFSWPLLLTAMWCGQQKVEQLLTVETRTLLPRNSFPHNGCSMAVKRKNRSNVCSTHASKHFLLLHLMLAWKRLNITCNRLSRPSPAGNKKGLIHQQESTHQQRWINLFLVTAYCLYLSRTITP